MRVLYRTVIAFLTFKLVNLAVNAVLFPVLTANADLRTGSTRRRSLLVPMRDEVLRLPATLDGLLAQDVDELIFLDDESTDGSRTLVEKGAGAHARVRVVSGAPRPPGWAGKTWAMQQLVQEATGDVLIFCDADVVLGAGAVETIVREMNRQRAEAFSVFPAQRTGTVGEELLVPLIDDVLLCFLPFPLLSAPVPQAATANGSVLAFSRETLDLMNGFQAVRAAVVEDVAMAREVRRNGHRLGLALGGEVVSTRMYSSGRDMIDGFGRGLRPVAGGSRALVLVGLGWHLLAYSLPVALVGARRWRWALPTLLAVAERAAVEAKTGRRRWWSATTMSLSPLAAVPVVLRAMRREQTWKGRSYT